MAPESQKDATAAPAAFITILNDKLAARNLYSDQEDGVVAQRIRETVLYCGSMCVAAVHVLNCDTFYLFILLYLYWYKVY